MASDNKEKQEQQWFHSLKFKKHLLLIFYQALKMGEVIKTGISGNVNRIYNHAEFNYFT